MSDSNNGVLTPVSEHEIQVFDLDRGVRVNSAICQLHKDADAILGLMRGSLFNGDKQHHPVMDTRTYQSISEMVAVLDELSRLTRPVIQSRF